MKQLINDGWSFVKLACGSTLEDALKACFEPVDLPHDWLIWQEDLYESADAWYQRKIVRNENGGGITLLRFDGVYMDCDVLLNGEIIFSHPYGYTAFDVPLTGKLHAGANTVMVHIRHQSPNSRWYSGSGIYRDVFLVTLPENHMVPDGLSVSERETGNGWYLDVTAETAGPGKALFRCFLTGADGSYVCSAEGAHENGKVRAALSVPDARNWSPDDPYLYSLTLIYGEQTEVIRIGLRSVLLDPDHGFQMNHHPLKLHGVCLHHDLGALGAAFHEKAARRQLRLMKQMGVNAVRTSHNPPASKFLDLCDELGILVVDEAFDMWERSKTQYDYARFFKENVRKDVASWIRRDRCHPCVIMWSVGNEIYDMHADAQGAGITEFLAGLVRLHDPDRHAFVTFGCNYMPWEGGQHCAEYVDAVGYNYGEKLYSMHHREHPRWVIYGSETGSMLSSRGVYHFPAEESIMCEADEQCSALGNSNTSWGADNLPKLIFDDLHNQFSLGQFIWSGTDYIGEPTPYHTRSCYFGQADTACFPKDSFYLFQCFWTDRQTVHIGVSWDWNIGQMIDIPVMTNCCETELFLNGKSIGRKKNTLISDGILPMWKIPFEPGILQALAYNADGTIACRDLQVTPGETDHFILSPEDPFILSDGWDLAFVHITAADPDGHPVLNARDRIVIEVSGGGRLIGTDNGDPTDTDSYKSACRRLFNGKLLIIAGSNGKKEPLRIRVTGSLRSVAETVIPVKTALPLPGISCVQRIPPCSRDIVVPIRRIDLQAEENPNLTPEHPQCSFRFRVLPDGAVSGHIDWQITNSAGIQVPNASLTAKDQSVTVGVQSNGTFYLRALYGEKEGKTDFISQIEFSAEGFGFPALNPYQYIPAALYDFSEGAIGAGNEKGISFDSDESSMIGFSRIDFGNAGTDRIHIDLFALNDELYEMELLAGQPGKPPVPVASLPYCKPSLWNVYQGENWKLPHRLQGILTICFRINAKVHMKGFCFEKQPDACFRRSAISADRISGDHFQILKDGVYGIGNNVTLTWNSIDFGTVNDAILELDGHTSHPVNTVHIRIMDTEKNVVSSIAEFQGNHHPVQRFRIFVLPGVCSVSFVFLPGCSFDFRGFRFLQIQETDSTVNCGKGRIR